jgi:hypothetical protein
LHDTDHLAMTSLPFNQRSQFDLPLRATVTRDTADFLRCLPRKSILSPVESINLGIDFQAHTTTPKGWPLLVSKMQRVRP